MGKFFAIVFSFSTSISVFTIFFVYNFLYLANLFPLNLPIYFSVTYLPVLFSENNLSIFHLLFVYNWLPLANLFLLRAKLVHSF